MRKFINAALMIVLLVLVLGLLLATGAETDRPNIKEPGGDIDISREDISRLVEIIKIWKIVDELGLKEEQLLEFLPRFKELNDLRAEQLRDRGEAVAELRKLLETNASEDRIKSAIDKIKNLEIKFRQKEQQLKESLESKLSVKQQAKYIVFQDEYWRDMQRLMRNLKELSNLREQRLKPQLKREK